MYFKETLKSVEMVLATNEVPLIVGESGIGKTALAKTLAAQNKWTLVVVDGNLLKEGEIGGLPTVATYTVKNEKGEVTQQKTTIYAVHHKLRAIDHAVEKGETVLLFIDEINRCEHTVQQELMNLILNREINGYTLHPKVKIMAAMNPSSDDGDDFDYQVVDMDPAQKNRFVWLFMESDAAQWIEWALKEKIDHKIIDFIATFPTYLNKKNSNDLDATPRSYERIAKAYAYYKSQEDIPRTIFLNILKGNIGQTLGEELLHFLEKDYLPLISYEDLMCGEDVSERILQNISQENHTRLYLAAQKIFYEIEKHIEATNQEVVITRLMKLLDHYPVDLKIGLMKDMRKSYPHLYNHALSNDCFVDAYFNAYHGMGQ